MGTREERDGADEVGEEEARAVETAAEGTGAEWVETERAGAERTGADMIGEEGAGAEWAEAERAGAEGTLAEGAGPEATAAKGSRAAGTAEWAAALGSKRGSHVLLEGAPRRLRDAARDALTLRSLLLCLGAATGHQVTIHSQLFAHMPPVEYMPPSIAAVFNAAHSTGIPTLLHTDGKELVNMTLVPIRGLMHVVMLPSQSTKSNIKIISEFLFLCLSTNVFGVFIMIYARGSKVQKKDILDTRFYFLQRMGTGKLVQIVLQDQPLVFAADSHEMSEHVMYSVNGNIHMFCEKWQDGAPKRELEMYQIGDLSAFSINKVLTEWNTWVDSDGVEYFDGPEKKLIEILVLLGIGKVMEGNQPTLSQHLFGDVTASIIPGKHVPVLTKSGYWIQWRIPTVTTFQSDTALVARRAPRLPYTLALMLPYELALWLATTTTMIVC